MDREPRRVGPPVGDRSNRHPRLWLLRYRENTSEYVFDEAVTLVRSHRGYREARVVGDRILGIGEFPTAYDLLTVSPDDFETAIEVFETYRDHPLSFTDATTIALMDAHRIDSLLSFDTDFDGIVDRLAPGEVAAASG